MSTWELGLRSLVSSKYMCTVGGPNLLSLVTSLQVFYSHKLWCRIFILGMGENIFTRKRVQH